MAKQQNGPRATERRPRSTGAAVSRTQVVGDTLAIDLELTQLNTDPAQYKPNAPTFMLEGVFVRVEIPLSEVIEHDHGTIILTPKGCALISDQISTGYQAALHSSIARNRS